MCWTGTLASFRQTASSKAAPFDFKYLPSLSRGNCFVLPVLSGLCPGNSQFIIPNSLGGHYIITNVNNQVKYRTWRNIPPAVPIQGQSPTRQFVVGGSRAAGRWLISTDRDLPRRGHSAVEFLRIVLYADVEGLFICVEFEVFRHSPRVPACGVSTERHDASAILSPSVRVMITLGSSDTHFPIFPSLPLADRGRTISSRSRIMISSSGSIRTVSTLNSSPGLILCPLAGEDFKRLHTFVSELKR